MKNEFDDYELDDIFGKDPEWKIVLLKDFNYLYIMEKREERRAIILPGYRYTYIDRINFEPKYDENSQIWIANTEQREILKLNRTYLYKDLPKEIKDRL